MTKTEQSLIDLMAEGKTLKPQGKRQWDAFDKITDALHSKGNFGPLVGFVVPLGHRYYQFVPQSLARDFYAEHYSGGPGTRHISFRS